MGTNWPAGWERANTNWVSQHLGSNQLRIECPGVKMTGYLNSPWTVKRPPTHYAHFEKLSSLEG